MPVKNGKGTHPLRTSSCTILSFQLTCDTFPTSSKHTNTNTQRITIIKNNKKKKGFGCRTQRRFQNAIRPKQNKSTLSFFLSSKPRRNFLVFFFFVVDLCTHTLFLSCLRVFDPWMRCSCFVSFFERSQQCKRSDENLLARKKKQKKRNERVFSFFRSLSLSLSLSRALKERERERSRARDHVRVAFVDDRRRIR